MIRDSQQGAQNPLMQQFKRNAADARPQWFGFLGENVGWRLFDGIRTGRHLQSLVRSSFWRQYHWDTQQMP